MGAAAFDPGAADAPLVTAVVPAYNAEKTIDETLKSVRAQTYRNLEILVVDDGSTDRTPALVEAHASAYPRVRPIRQANAGGAAARNAAISDCLPPILRCSVDADDPVDANKASRGSRWILRRPGRGGPRCGLVHTWQSTHPTSTGGRRRPAAGGNPIADVLPRMLDGQFVGAGSPRSGQAISHPSRPVGTHASLRERGAQRREDFTTLTFKISDIDT